MILQPLCEKTGGFCWYDERYLIRCECPMNTNYVKDMGCTGKIFKYTTKFNCIFPEIIAMEIY